MLNLMSDNTGEQWLVTRSKLTSVMQRQFVGDFNDVLHVCEFVRQK